MNINATVFIQAVNFGITYLFLKKVLFKPIVQRIEQKESAKEKMLGTIKNRETRLLDLQNEKTENLQTFRLNAKKFYDIDITCEQKVPAMINYKKDPELQEKIIEYTKARLVKMVPHAY